MNNHGETKNEMEIGSIFEIDPARAKEAQEERPLRLPQVEKYGKRNCCFTASGREAIGLCLKSLAAARPDLKKRCLMPAYMCESVFFPFLQNGWKLIFYAVDRGLSSCGEEVFSLARQHDPGLIFLHPYYGADTCRELQRQLQTLRKNGILLMEDVTQSYYLETAGREADFVVGSLRKWHPIPDGGFAASDLPLLEELLESGEEYGRARLAPLTQKWEFLHGEANEAERAKRKEAFLAKNRGLEEELDRYQGLRRMSGLSRSMLAAVDDLDARKKRAENYQYLYEKTSNMHCVRPILPSQENEAPLYFAVYARDRDELQAFLRDRDIYAPVLWPVGAANREAQGGDESYIYSHMLALPIDQRYGRAEAARIAEALLSYENRPVIGIRADLNDTVATGHIMRCVTIAKQLKKRGCRVLFFTADEESDETLSQAGMEWICLHTRWNRMEEELPQLKELLAQTGVETLLVDSYQAPPAYFAALQGSVRLACIDDCFDAVYPVDLLINYNAYHVRFPYEKAYGGRAKLLLGTAYVPLREEFGAPRERDMDAPDKPFSILLASGGGDSCNALLGILQEAFAGDWFPDAAFHVVVGKGHPKWEELSAFAAAHPRVLLYRPCEDMAGLMAACDAAVSAAGTMLFELSAMQAPTVFFVAADNQRYDSEFFATNGRMLFAGDIRQDREGCIRAICESLLRLKEDDALRERMKAKLAAVTDGAGAARIAEEILGLSERKRREV